MKWFFSALAILVCVLVVFFLFKNRPTGQSSAKIMNPTYFNDVGEVGRVLSRRFYVDIKKSKLIILGSSPLIRDYDIIWKNYIKTGMADGIHFAKFYSLEGLRPITQEDVVIDQLPETDIEMSGITIIQVPADELWKEKVENAYPEADQIIFQYPYSLDQHQLEKLGLTCNGENDVSFSCLSHKAGSRYYRKKLTDNRLTAMMEQFSVNFYLLFIGEPF